jgi:ketosteroid isomerase-like protein
MCCSLMLGPPALGQQWSPAQTAVWKNVEAYWARDAAGDLDGFMSYIHDDYVGWDRNGPMAHDKSQLRKYLEHAWTTEKTILQDVQPVAINVIDDVAVVHYYFWVITKDSDAKEHERSGRFTDVMMRQGDKWVLIGDHGGSNPEE